MTSRQTSFARLASDLCSSASLIMLTNCRTTWAHQHHFNHAQISSSTRSNLDTIQRLRSSSLGSLVASRCNEVRIDTCILDSRRSFLQAKVARLHDRFVERLHLDHTFDRSSFAFLPSFITPAHATTAVPMVWVALILRFSPLSCLFWCNVGGLFDQINSMHA